MTRCPFCDHKNPPGATHCAECGAELAVSSGPAAEIFEKTLRELVESGERLAAIKAYRQRTGTDLKSAKDAIEALERGDRVTLPDAISPGVGAPADLLSLLRAGKKVEAVKAYRAKTGAALAESVQAIEALAAQHGIETRGSGCAAATILLVWAVGSVMYHVV